MPARFDATSDATSAARVDDAIMRVLQAEQAARAAVRRAAIEADDLRAAARERAHAIAERAAVRVARVHRSMDAAIAARLDELQRQRTALSAAPAEDPTESARVARALDRLAMELLESAQ